MREYFGTSTACSKSTQANRALSSTRELSLREFNSIWQAARGTPEDPSTCTGHVSAWLWLTTCGSREIFVAKRTLSSRRDARMHPHTRPRCVGRRTDNARVRISNSKENNARTVPTPETPLCARGVERATNRAPPRTHLTKRARSRERGPRNPARFRRVKSVLSLTSSHVARVRKEWIRET